MKILRVAIVGVLISVTTVIGVSAKASNQVDSFKSQGWMDLKNSNQKWTGISQRFRSEKRPDYLDYDFAIECKSKKQLEISLVSDPKGMKPILNANGTGYAQIKIDGGKFMKYAYVEIDRLTVKFAPTISVSSDALLAAMLKGKQQIVIVAPTAVSSNSTYTIKLGNLKSYANKFKSAGCPLL